MQNARHIPNMKRLVVRTLFFLLFASAPCMAEKPIWAKKGVSFPASCFSDSVQDCPLLRIPSPDRHSLIEVRYRKLTLDNGDWLLTVHLQVIRGDGQRSEIEPPGDVDDELLWSPDSKSFLINGSGGGEGPDSVAVYRLSDPNLRPIVVTAAAQRDMLRSFPPCKAKGADPQECGSMASDLETVNVSAVDWTRRSSAVVVMAEMPCSSSVGGIMCQVLGYELEVPSGKIVRRMEAKEFAKLWQHSMAWKFHIPGPPE